VKVLPLSHRSALFLLVLCVTAVDTTAVNAHDRGTSYSSWTLRGRDAHVVVRLTELEVSRFPWAAGGVPARERRLASYLPEHLRLMAGDTSCPLSDGPRSLQAPPGHLAVEWSVACPADGSLRMRSELLRDVSATHLHFARLKRGSAAPVERVLSERDSLWVFDDGSRDGTARDVHGAGVADYVRLGIEHILSGYDHLAFLLALILIGGSLLDVAKMVTGFTVAHSLTLALMVLGYLQPNTASVEALIGLSIALVAAENLWLAGARHRFLPWGAVAALLLLAVAASNGYGSVPTLTLVGLALFTICYFELLQRSPRPASVRWCVAFIFGLIHGFGFAGMLGQAGVPQDRIVAALFGFNAGVELGQLAAVCTVWPLLRAVTRPDRPRLRAVVVEAASAAVFAVGMFWFAARAYG
jgi:hypothetical protein